MARGVSCVLGTLVAWLGLAISPLAAQWASPPEQIAVRLPGTAGPFTPAHVRSEPLAAGTTAVERVAEPDNVFPAAARHPSEMAYVDLDVYGVDMGVPTPLPPRPVWSWQLLPDGLVYPPYLAGTKQSRFAARIFNLPDDGFASGASWIFDATLGTRVGLLRFGDRNAASPEGFQIDAEGSAQLRLDIPSDVDVRSVDFRAGLPLSYGWGRHRTRFGYYHLSSHLGDEFLLARPGSERFNFSRDVLILGHTFFVTRRLRVYAEAGWAFKQDISGPWEFQFGVDYAPIAPTGPHGAPFAAINGHLREEVNFGGAVTVQAGWAWRPGWDSRMLRLGLHYLNGESNQWSFFDDHEQQIGFGLWYDF